MGDPDRGRKYIGLRKIDAEHASWIATARDAEARFERTVYKVDFGRIALAKPRTPHLKAWRDGLVISKASANRTLTALSSMNKRAIRSTLIGTPGVTVALASGPVLAISFRLTSP